MAPIEGSASKVLRAAFSSWISGVKRALRALGRWSWTGRGLLVWMETDEGGCPGRPTHSYACSRYGDLEELILLLGCAGVAGS